MFCHLVKLDDYTDGISCTSANRLYQAIFSFPPTPEKMAWQKATQCKDLHFVQRGASFLHPVCVWFSVAAQPKLRKEVVIEECSSVPGHHINFTR